jgi:hypothetical protein
LLCLLLLFLLLLLAPDLAIIGYAFGPRTGSVVYNLAHTYVLPLLLVGLALLVGSSLLLLLAFIWLAHLGLDRMLGYGLKRTTGFRDTHLGPIGRETSS